MKRVLLTTAIAASTILGIAIPVYAEFPENQISTNAIASNIEALSSLHKNPFQIAQTSSTKQVRVELIDVYCRDTEDVTGPDEFYLVGAVATNERKPSVGEILTKPTSINDKQRKNFRTSESVVFDKQVPANAKLLIAMRAFDEDAAKDWNKYGSIATKISDGVATALTATGEPTAATAGTVLKASVKAVGFFMSLDKDDNLGDYQTEFDVSKLRKGENIVNWNFKKGKKCPWYKLACNYSNWDYTVSYRITVD